MRRYVIFGALAMWGLLAFGCDSSTNAGDEFPCGGTTFTLTLFASSGTAAPELKQCLSRSLGVDSEGRADCVAISGSTQSTCSCDAPGLRPVDAKYDGAVEILAEQGAAGEAGWNCYCEVVPLVGDERMACQVDTSSEPVTPQGGAVDGYCYVDATSVPPIGNPELTAACNPAERRVLRFLGDELLQPSGGLLMACQQDSPSCPDD